MAIAARKISVFISSTSHVPRDYVSLLVSVLREMIREHVERVPWARSITIEPKDIEAWGLFGHWWRTQFGRLLNTLVRAGYAKKVSKRRYVINELGISWVLTCRFPDCRNESLCPLWGACPYFKLGLVGVRRHY